MWKRRQQHKPGRLQAAGDSSPGDALVEGVPYGGVQTSFVNVDTSPQDDRSYRPPVRLPRDAPTGLPRLPFQPAPIPPPETGERPPSSIYDLPPPTPLQTRLPRHSSVARKYGEQVEISPPSSPEISAADSRQGNFAHGRATSPNISPVEEMPDVSKLPINEPGSRPGSRAAGTNIPVLRREKRRNQIGTAAANLMSKKESEYSDGIRNKKNIDTRWDTLTGEPTMSERGRPQQVKPSEFAPPGNSIYDTAEDHGMGLRTTGTSIAKDQSSFGDRVKKLTGNPMMTGARPEWKGSSGRATIVPPVADQVIDRPKLDIPRKSSKRATSPRNAGPGASTSVSVILNSQPETSIVSPPASGYAGPIRKPLSPPQEGPSSPPRYLTSPTSLSPQTSDVPTQSYSSPTTTEPTSQNQYTSHMSSQDQRQPLSGSSEDHVNRLHRKDSISSIERQFREAFNSVNFPKATREQPVSRFSVTTYATSTADSTPRVSTDEPPPMPTPPKDITPIVNRRRPQVGGGSFDSTKATARKAVPGSPVFISMSNRDSASWRNSKMLPKSPPEAASVDLITSLQAQLDNLAHRRANIQKSIHQMTQLMPTDPLARGMEARRQAEEKQKVEILKEDLADVVREEHDLGLRLHRALKRRDQNAVYEPTGLWVRRVTG